MLFRLFSTNINRFIYPCMFHMNCVTLANWHKNVGVRWRIDPRRWRNDSWRNDSLAKRPQFLTCTVSTSAPHNFLFCLYFFLILNKISFNSVATNGDQVGCFSKSSSKPGSWAKQNKIFFIKKSYLWKVSNKRWIILRFECQISCKSIQQFCIWYERH